MASFHPHATCPSICFFTDNGFTKPKPSSNAMSMRSSLTAPALLTDTVHTTAQIVHTSASSRLFRRSSMAMPRAHPSGSGFPHPDISAAMSSAFSQSSLKTK